MKPCKLIIKIMVLLLACVSAPGEAATRLGNLDDARLLKYADTMFMRRADIDEAYRSYSEFTRRHPEDDDSNKEVRRQLADAYNRLAIIDMSFRRDYPEALRSLIRAREYSDGHPSAALLSSLGHINNFYSQCLPTHDNIRRALGYYHQAFHQAVAEKDWETASLAFCNSANFGFEPWIIDFNRALVDSFRYISSAFKLGVYREAALTHRVMEAAGRRDWYAANQSAWELATYMKAKKMAADVMAFPCMLLTRIDQASGINDSLGEHAIMLLEQARNANLIGEAQYACQMLAQYYHERGDSAMTARYRTLYLDTRDSLLVHYQLSSIHGGYLMYQLDNVDAEMAGVRHKLLMRNLVLAMTIVGTAVILFLLLRVRKKNRQLRERNERLYDNYQGMAERENEARAAAAAALSAAAAAPATTSENAPAATPRHPASTLTDVEKTALLARVEKALADTDTICSPDCTVASLASLCGDSVKNVSQVINEHYGRTFTAVLTEARIREAARRISDSTLYDNFTIEAIATDVGFSSRGGFVRAFKRQTGLNPSEFIALAKERRKP